MILKIPGFVVYGFGQPAGPGWKGDHALRYHVCMISQCILKEMLPRDAVPLTNDT